MHSAQRSKPRDGSDDKQKAMSSRSGLDTLRRRRQRTNSWCAIIASTTSSDAAPRHRPPGGEAVEQVWREMRRGWAAKWGTASVRIFSEEP